MAAMWNGSQGRVIDRVSIGKVIYRATAIITLHRKPAHGLPLRDLGIILQGRFPVQLQEKNWGFRHDTLEGTGSYLIIGDCRVFISLKSPLLRPVT